MSDPFIALITVIALFALIAARVPIAFSLAASGAIGLILTTDVTLTGTILGTAPFSSTSSLALAVIPMFILMGMLAEEAGVPGGLFRIAAKWLRRLPGGLAVATVVAGAGFGAVTGSSVASAATMGRMSLGEMRRHGYRMDFASGSVAMAGTLGVLIPPSVVLVLYGVVTGESIGQLLLAGIIPGVLSAISFAIIVITRAKMTPAKVFTLDRSGGPATAQSEGTAVRPEGTAVRRRDYRHLLWIGLVFVLVIGGIYTGRFTATESGAVGALILMALLLVERFRSGPREIGKSFFRVARNAASTSAMMLAIVIGASIFSASLTRTGVTKQITSVLSGLDVPPLLVVAVFVFLLLVLGMFLETTSLMLIAIPLMYPVVVGLGLNGIWFGIVAAKAIEVGLVTPPVGMNAYVVAGAVKGLKVEQVFKGILPFYIAEFTVFTLLFALPSIATWLPASTQ